MVNCAKVPEANADGLTMLEIAEEMGINYRGRVPHPEGRAGPSLQLDRGPPAQRDYQGPPPGGTMRLVYYRSWWKIL